MRNLFKLKNLLIVFLFANFFISIAYSYFNTVPAEALVNSSTVALAPGAPPVIINYGVSENQYCKVEIGLLSNDSLSVAHLISAPIGNIKCPKPTVSGNVVTIIAGSQKLTLTVTIVGVEGVYCQRKISGAGRDFTILTIALFSDGTAARTTKQFHLNNMPNLGMVPSSYCQQTLEEMKRTADGRYTLAHPNKISVTFAPNLYSNFTGTYSVKNNQIQTLSVTGGYNNSDSWVLTRKL